MSDERPPVGKMTDDELRREGIELGSKIVRDHQPGQALVAVSEKVLRRFQAVRDEQERRRTKGQTAVD